MRCTNCGAEVDSNETKCPYCKSEFPKKENTINYINNYYGNSKTVDSEDSSDDYAKCPKCGKDIIVLKTKKGRTYYGCEGYPECDYMSWNKPLQKK